MKCTVFYECWQMECCGRAFSIGDMVKWLVYKIEQEQLLTPVDLGTVDYCYEAHDANWEKLFVLEGKVETIKILYETFRPTEDNPRMLVSVGGRLVHSERAKGFEKKIDGMEPTGYIVELSECSIRHAEQKEVTFR